MTDNNSNSLVDFLIHSNYKEITKEEIEHILPILKISYNRVEYLFGLFVCVNKDTSSTEILDNNGDVVKVFKDTTYKVEYIDKNIVKIDRTNKSMFVTRYGRNDYIDVNNKSIIHLVQEKEQRGLFFGIKDKDYNIEVLKEGLYSVSKYCSNRIGRVDVKALFGYSEKYNRIVQITPYCYDWIKLESETSLRTKVKVGFCSKDVYPVTRGYTFNTLNINPDNSYTEYFTIAPLCELKDTGKSVVSYNVDNKIKGDKIKYRVVDSAKGIFSDKFYDDVVYSRDYYETGFIKVVNETDGVETKVGLIDTDSFKEVVECKYKDINITPFKNIVLVRNLDDTKNLLKYDDKTGMFMGRFNNGFLNDYSLYNSNLGIGICNMLMSDNQIYYLGNDSNLHKEIYNAFSLYRIEIKNKVIAETLNRKKLSVERMIVINLYGNFKLVNNELYYSPYTEMLLIDTLKEQYSIDSCLKDLLSIAVTNNDICIKMN